MIVDSHENIFNKISSTIRGATESIILLTGKLNEDIVSEISRKAASGVKTTVVTSDKNWSRYLENLSKSYGRQDEEKLRKIIENLTFKARLYSRMKYIILVISISIAAILLVRFGIDVLTIIVSALVIIINVLSFILFNKGEKNINNELLIENENLQRELDQLKDTRERLSKNLQVIESIDISFTLVIADEKALITSYISNYEKNSLHYFEEINKDEGLKIVSFILNLNKSG